jgi:hypothetical protein
LTWINLTQVLRKIRAAMAPGSTSLIASAAMSLRSISFNGDALRCDL